MIGDIASSHYSHQVLDYLRMLWIQIWTSEPCYQHQNPFERRYQTFKRIVNRTMDRTGTPPHLWYLCICYVAHVLNRVSVFQLWIPNTNKILHRSALHSAVTSENWNLCADDSLHKSTDSFNGTPSSTAFADGEISQFAEPATTQAQGFALIQKGRDILQMGRNLFVQDNITSGSNSNFIH